MSVRRNLTIAFVQKQAQTLIAVASVMILSRLVTPEETGIFSIGTAVAALTHAVRDFGVGNFLIKEPMISNEKIRTAFTVSALIAVALSVLLLAIARPVADFYGKPEVATVVQITTLGLLVSPLSTVNLALLLRDKRFFDMFKVSIVGAAAGALVSIYFAWQGQGAKALALGALANSIGLVAMANVIVPRFQDYVPSLQFWRPILRFGIHSTLSGLSEQIGARASDLIVGKMLGFGPVGILSRSGSLITVFQDSVLSATAPVVLSSMASDAREGLKASEKVLTSIEYASWVAWPFFAGLAIFSHDATLLLFGKLWLAAAPYTAMLCLAASLSVLSAFSPIAATAIGRVDLVSRYNMASQGIRVLLIAFGALFGLYGVTLGLVAAALVQCILAYIILSPAAPVRIGEILRRTWRSLGIAICVSTALYFVNIYVDSTVLIRALSAVLCAMVTGIAATIIFRHPAANVIAARFARGVVKKHAGV